MAWWTETVSRDGLCRAPDPAGVQLGRIKAAYRRWPTGEEPTDDAAVMERAGGQVAMGPGDPMLMKLTYPQDFLLAEQLAAGAGSSAWARASTPIASAPATSSGCAASGSSTTLA
jgi:2-C-methyl-D-erythritol 4-phosphate cytidylyltransferase